MSEDGVTLISYNRPLTHSARKALSEFTIVDERDVSELGHWTEIDVKTCPPDELLEKHELKRDDPTGGEDPEVVYKSPDGKRIEIYEDKVFEGDREANIGPEKAKASAEEADWEKVES